MTNVQTCKMYPYLTLIAKLGHLVWMLLKAVTAICSSYFKWCLVLQNTSKAPHWPESYFTWVLSAHNWNIVKGLLALRLTWIIKSGRNCTYHNSSLCSDWIIIFHAWGIFCVYFCCQGMCKLWYDWIFIFHVWDNFGVYFNFGLTYCL